MRDVKLDDLDDALTPGDAATARARRLLLALEEAPHTLPLADLDALRSSWRRSKSCARR